LHRRFPGFKAQYSISRSPSDRLPISNVATGGDIFLIKSIELRPLHSSTISCPYWTISGDNQNCFISLYNSRTSILANNASTSVKTDKINVIERLQAPSLFLTSVMRRLATRGTHIFCINSKSPLDYRETRYLVLDWTIVPEAVRANIEPEGYPMLPTTLITWSPGMELSAHCTLSLRLFAQA
jgi:hypothetical protein